MNTEELMPAYSIPVDGHERPGHRGGGEAEADLGRRIERTIAFMREHLDQPVSAPLLASRASLSLSHYFALFKRLTGRTPIDYLTDLRMQRGRHLLETTAWSVKEVAAALGYEDPFYFSRVFKAVNGVAPTDYRSSLNRKAAGLRGERSSPSALPTSGNTRAQPSNNLRKERPYSFAVAGVSSAA